MGARVLKGGDALEAYLANLSQKVANASEVRIGFLEGPLEPNGTPVPLVAATMNFGAPSKNIPPRPFFSDMIEKHSGEWGDDIAELLVRTDYDAGATLVLQGEHIKRQLRQSIVDFNSVPLSPKTIARKGFDKQLVDTGKLLGSVDSEVS